MFTLWQLAHPFSHPCWTTCQSLCPTLPPFSTLPSPSACAAPVSSVFLVCYLGSCSRRCRHDCSCARGRTSLACLAFLACHRASGAQPSVSPCSSLQVSSPYPVCQTICLPPCGSTAVCHSKTVCLPTGAIFLCASVCQLFPSLNSLLLIKSLYYSGSCH